ncbi:hypothetical protein DVH24_002563 [Malus domestica]|uniref:Uncharacterized protein n=1 Tax=Malus domestica TaxID=3750 RepID=A0A498K9I3_MALDO|nr:hypothetical protein DVH24_002563 [Malus domestica]
MGLSESELGIELVKWRIKTSNVHRKQLSMGSLPPSSSVGAGSPGSPMDFLSEPCRSKNISSAGFET